MPLIAVESSGIIFLDEIDKIAGREGGHGPDVSREGVQRDILPIVEGTTVNTRHGFVRTDHILFIAAGAFHVSKPQRPDPRTPGPVSDSRGSRSRSRSKTSCAFFKEPKNALPPNSTLRCSKRKASSSKLTDDALLEVSEVRRPGERVFREYRRPATAHDHGETARGDLIRGAGSAEEERQSRCGFTCAKQVRPTLSRIRT